MEQARHQLCYLHPRYHWWRQTWCPPAICLCATTRPRDYDRARQVTQADDISLTPIAGTFNLDWLALTERERNQWSPNLLAKHVVLIAVGLKYRRLRSSMLRAIEAGKEPAVEFLNGEVTRAGKRLGVPTPVNDLAISWVHDIAAGIRVSSVSTLHELYEASRH